MVRRIRCRLDEVYRYVRVTYTFILLFFRTQTHLHFTIGCSCWRHIVSISLCGVIVARLSPDAYIQMALQLAWYRSRGTFTATYETVLTRLFDRGRTETIRTLTADSRAWVLAMDNESSSVRPFRSISLEIRNLMFTRCRSQLRSRFALLRLAIQTHTSLTRSGATGKGIDRHLLGLRLMLRPDEGEKSDLFEDGVFGESQSWKLSTSGLSAGYLFRGTGCVFVFCSA